jgi:tRNA nucleotidyltransferase/poly(A) polymerase
MKPIHKIYKVGGCVRDKLLGLNSKDIDFTFVLEDVNKSVEDGFREMTEWMTGAGYTIFLSTPDCYTIRAKFPNDHKNKGMVADFVLARKEVGYYEGTRRPILELGTLEDDLIRRDFTLNALAEDEDGRIIDLFNGIADLSYNGIGILKTPLPAAQTMMDDPLRLIRALRFKITKGFQISDDIWLAMGHHDILKKLEQTVSGERIREEVYKMMKVNTVETILLLNRVEEMNPGFLRLVFKNGLWLKPTFEI